MSESPDRRALLAQALRAVDEMRSRLAASESAKREPIAIVGMGCRYPGGATNPGEYWRMLRAGVDGTSTIPADRWDADAYYDPDPQAVGKIVTRRGGFIGEIDRFEPTFFGISAREAASLDPQQRLVLEVCWEALENAAIAPDTLKRSLTGIFIGISTTEYARTLEAAGVSDNDLYTATGNAVNCAAGRVSFTLNLHGPCVAVDTACSSSLTAVHLACQSLRSGESDLALAGGVNLILSATSTALVSRWGMLSTDGRCKTFDERADGFGRAEGCGVVALKRLSDARAAGDPILAVILGSAVNSDGASSGLTVPSGPAQELVVRAALERAGINPAEIDLVETHGTGTPLGDPIEVEALAAVTDAGRAADHPVWLGAAKANIGHTEAASGVAGLIKLVLQLQNEEIPPHPTLEKLNPRIPWSNYKVAVPREVTPWPRSARRRVAGVSSFGFSGTNAHVVVAEAPADAIPAAAAAETPSARPRVIVLSARGDKALLESAQRLSDHLEGRPDLPIAAVARTMSTGRSAFNWRGAVIATDVAEARCRLSALAAGRESAGVLRGRATAEAPRVAFLFTGQGAQYAGMARSLYEQEPVFRQALERCAAAVADRLEKPLLDVMFGVEGTAGLIDRTGYTQPALFALEWSLSELWRTWGVTPHAVLGHSVGEFVAATVAGVFSVEDGLALIAERARLMESLPDGGAMVAVQASEERIRPLLAPFAATVSVAAVNGPQGVVISGAGADVVRVVELIEKEGIKHRALTVSHAFHSPLMEPMLDGLERAARAVVHEAPQIDLVSNLSGTLAQPGDLGASYWRRHAREAVRFADGLAELNRLGCTAWVEIGPAPVLLGMAQRAGATEGVATATSLRKGRDDRSSLLDAAASLWTRGVRVDWTRVEPEKAQRLALPTYPFQRQRHWAADGKPVRAPSAPAGTHPLLGHRIRTAAGEAPFESILDSTNPAFLAEHCFYDRAVMPGAAYVEMARAAAVATGIASPAITDVEILEPLFLAEDEESVVQTVTRTEATGTRIQIFSQSAGGDWKLHASAKARPASPAPAIDLESLRARFSQPVVVDQYYARFPEAGVGLGTTFRSVRELWSGDGEALGRSRLPPATANAAAYGIHPALLDAAAFQILGAGFGLVGSDQSEGFMPVAIDEVGFHGAPTEDVWSHVTVKRDGPSALVATVRLMDEAGRVFITLDGVRLRRATAAALSRSRPDRHADWLYELAFKPRPIAAPVSPGPGPWLVFADYNGTGQAVTRLLKEQGVEARAVRRGPALSEGDEYTIRAEESADWDRVLQAAGGKGLQGILYLWSLDASDNRGVAQGPGTVCREALALYQALERAGMRTRTLFATRGGQILGDEPLPICLAQAPLWGMFRSLRAEARDWPMVLIDIAPGTVGDAELLQEIRASDGEDQTAWRGGQRHAVRLVRSKHPDAPARDGEAVRLVVSTPGVLDGVGLVALQRRPPQADEVEVALEGCGINFRDVLNVLGMYPGPPMPLGNEGAGRVVAVGAGVTRMKVGDQVIALGSGTHASHLTTRLDYVAPKPAAMSMAQAAGLPTTFLTALYGLRDLAGVGKNGRVLVHAAAGGVGLAAIQVAHDLGAEVFATAGSPEKREFVRSLGVRYVGDSRSTTYAEEIAAILGGEGLDAVLNSLISPHIPKSMALLRPGGMFLEIGKAEIWDKARVAEARPDIRYEAYDLAAIFEADRVLGQRMLTELVNSFDGRFTPLPTRAFSIDQAPRAFRFMAQARQIGKIALTTRPGGLVVSADGAYLITGGLGGLGLVVARWLATKGAGSIVLMGRRPPTDDAARIIEELRAGGTAVSVATADVSDAAALKAVLDGIDPARPLRGVVHAAGVLDDGVATSLDWQRFDRVLAPKARGADNLSVLTEGLPLDFFVLFSSFSSLLGSPGQANYAAANSYLDALALHRRHRGLPAISLNWGAWAEVGMAAGLSERDRRRQESIGLGVITPEQGVSILESAMAKDIPSVGVLPVTWDRFLAQKPDGHDAAVLSDLAREVERGQKGAAAATVDAIDVKAAIAAVVGPERKALLERHVAAQVALVLQQAGEELDTGQSMQDLGLDSLMAVEVRNRLDATFGVTVPIAFILSEATLAELARTVGEGMEKGAAPGSTPAAPSGSGDEALLQALPDLSDQQVDKLLEEMLQRKPS